MMVQIDTSPEFVREVLPPCFSPASSPTLIAEFSRWQRYSVGDFMEAGLWIMCKWEGVEGMLDLLLLFDGAEVVTSYGREIWGEAAKMGRAGLYEDGKYSHGWSNRCGVDIMEIEAELGAEQGPREIKSHAFIFKAVLSGDRVGLEWDPIVFQTDWVDTPSSYREGTAQLTFRSNGHDLLDQIPVVSWDRPPASVVPASGSSDAGATIQTKPRRLSALGPRARLG